MAELDVTGLKLVDGLATLDRPTIEDYCAASAEYIQEATQIGSNKGKSAQFRLSHALAQVCLADLRDKGLSLDEAVAGERPTGGGLRIARAHVSDWKSTTHLVERAVGRFIRAGGRETDGDAPHLLEGIGVVAFDRETGEISQDLPPTGCGLRWEEFIDRIAGVYDARFGEF